MHGNQESSAETGPNSELNAVFGSARVSAGLDQTAPALHAAAAAFWKSALEPGALSPRMKQLVLVALHGTVTSLHSPGIERHVGRALDAGATAQDVLDVLLTIAGVANHALYFAVPVLMRELHASGHPDGEMPEASAQALAIKEEFIRTRGVWNEQRDVIVRMMPKYFAALSKISTVTWVDGSLSRKERELICIAIDCTVTHMFEPGLALHIRCALEHGATRAEILDVFQLASLTGLESYIRGAEAMFGSDSIPDR
jgi:alkylhydroperoxidase/carboxymuconolactone decarboxylase family protein YurZ